MLFRSNSTHYWGFSRIQSASHLPWITRCEKWRKNGANMRDQKDAHILYATKSICITSQCEGNQICNVEVQIITLSLFSPWFRCPTLNYRCDQCTYRGHSSDSGRCGKIMENFEIFTTFASFGWVTRNAATRRYGSCCGYWPILQYSQNQAVTDLLGGYRMLSHHAATVDGMRMVQNTIFEMDAMHAKERSRSLFLYLLCREFLRNSQTYWLGFSEKILSLFPPDVCKWKREREPTPTPFI